MSLEFLVDYKNNQNSTKFDVYGFGVTVFILITGKNPFVNLSEDQICESAKKGNRPKFPTNTKSNQKNLINKCWSHDPNERPPFNDICLCLESSEFVNKLINVEAFEKYKKHV